MSCKFPEHHSSGGRAGAGWLAALAIGAVIAAEWRAVLVTIAVCGVLAVSGVAVLALCRSASSAPYDAAWTDPQPATKPAFQLEVAPPAASQLAARVAELERELAERPQLEAPQQHLHLHGIDAGQLAAIIRQQQDAAWPVIEEKK